MPIPKRRPHSPAHLDCRKAARAQGLSSMGGGRHDHYPFYRISLAKYHYPSYLVRPLPGAGSPVAGPIQEPRDRFRPCLASTAGGH